MTQPAKRLCEGAGSTTAGCVFVNHAPTYSFNAKAFPQAAAHAWLIQNSTPSTPDRCRTKSRSTTWRQRAELAQPEPDLPHRLGEGER